MLDSTICWSDLIIVKTHFQEDIAVEKCLNILPKMI